MRENGTQFKDLVASYCESWDKHWQVWAANLETKSLLK